MLINHGHLLPVLTFPQTMSLLFGHLMNTLLSWPLVNGRYWVSLPEMAGSCNKRVKHRKPEKRISEENALPNFNNSQHRKKWWTSTQTNEQTKTQPVDNMPYVYWVAEKWKNILMSLYKIPREKKDANVRKQVLEMSQVKKIVPSNRERQRTVVPQSQQCSLRQWNFYSASDFYIFPLTPSLGCPVPFYKCPVSRWSHKSSLCKIRLLIFIYWLYLSTKV